MNRKLFDSIYSKLSSLGFIFIIFSAIVLSVKFINFGIDFTGGTNISFHSTRDFKNMQLFVNDISKKCDIKNITLTQEDEETYNIRFGSQNGSEIENQAKLSKIRAMENGVNDLYIMKVENIGPKMSKTFLHDSMLALGFAILSIFIYISIRFDFKFAFTGVLALIYDIIMSLGGKGKRNPNAGILAAWRKHVKSVASRENMKYGKESMKKAKMGKYGEEWEKIKKSMGKVKKGGDGDAEDEESPTMNGGDEDEESPTINGGDEDEEEIVEEEMSMNGGKRRRRRRTMRRSRKRGTRRRKTRRRKH